MYRRHLAAVIACPQNDMIPSTTSFFVIGLISLAM